MFQIGGLRGEQDDRGPGIYRAEKWLNARFVSTNGQGPRGDEGNEARAQCPLWSSFANSGQRSCHVRLVPKRTSLARLYIRERSISCRDDHVAIR